MDMLLLLEDHVTFPFLLLTILVDHMDLLYGKNNNDACLLHVQPIIEIDLFSPCVYQHMTPQGKCDNYLVILHIEHICTSW